MDSTENMMMSSETKNKILVIGDIMLDRYIIGRANRLCPEAPVPILTVDETQYFLGGAANVAANIRNIGGQVFLAGVVGKDEEGDMIRRMLKAKDISLVLGMDATRPTTVKTRIGTSEQLIVRLDRELCKDISPGIFHDILKVVTVLSDDLKLVTVSDHGKGVVTEDLMAAIIEISKLKKIPVFVDPKGINYKKYAGANVIKPNFAALEGLYGGEIDSLQALEDAVSMVFTITGCDTCIVTWESNGALLFNSPNDWIHFPCEARSNASYFSGAGDVFLAGLSMGVSMNLPLTTSCKIANQLAAGTVGGIGTMNANCKDWLQLVDNAFI